MIKKLTKQIMQKILPSYRIAQRIEKKFNAFKKIAPKAMLTAEVHLVDHCNLNCAYCDHFSPLASPEFLDPDEFGRDMARLSALFAGEAQFIKLMGGEPLLHPRISEFISIARRSFSYANIFLITNGLLLPKMPAKFFETCRENNIIITPTKYPCNIDYTVGEALARQHGAKYAYHDERIMHKATNAKKTMSKHVFDLNGEQDPNESFSECTHANSCLFLRHGRMYTCPIAANAHIFCRKFDIDLHQSDHDFIDIYKATSGSEILNFLAHPIPFCRYCDIEHNVHGLTWRKSQQDIKEWTR